jgi:hypothetical protein
VNEATPVAGVTLAVLHAATAFTNHFAQIGNVIKADSIFYKPPKLQLIPVDHTQD